MGLRMVSYSENRDGVPVMMNGIPEFGAILVGSVRRASLDGERRIIRLYRKRGHFDKRDRAFRIYC